jgi:hypothetical protein
MLDEFVEGIFHFDSTFWRSFLPLLFKPGFLTKEFLSGKRKPYTPPLRSYLILSLVYFLLTSLLISTHMRFVAPTGQELKTEDCAPIAAKAQWLRPFVPDVEGSCIRALQDQGHVFSNAIQGMFPKVMFVVLPLVALVQFWLYRRKQPLYVGNLIFILHFQSFYYLAGALLLLFGAGIGAIAGSKASGLTGALDAILLGCAVIYLFIANRRVYNASVFKNVCSLLALGLAYTVFWALGTSIVSLYAFLHA